jgi:hypothetical protein
MFSKKPIPKNNTKNNKTEITKTTMLICMVKSSFPLSLSVTECLKTRQLNRSWRNYFSILLVNILEKGQISLPLGHDEELKYFKLSFFQHKGCAANHKQ